MSELQSKLFIGSIVSENNDTSSTPFDMDEGGGRYMVHIFEIMHSIDTSEGIWCHNAMNTLSISETAMNNNMDSSTDHGVIVANSTTFKQSKDNNKQGMRGAYHPLTIGAKYYIRFVENDINSGQIIGMVPFDHE